MTCHQGQDCAQNVSIVRNDYIEIPRQLKQLTRNVTIDIDGMKVIKIPFLASVGQNVDFVTTEYLENETAKAMTKAMLNIVKLYWRYGFKVKMINVDIQFKANATDEALLERKSTMNWCAQKDHVPRIERKISSLKEIIRAGESHLSV